MHYEPYSHHDQRITFRMPFNIDQDALEFIRGHRVARLATSGADCRPAVIPICYVFDGERIYTPIDEKPKSVDAGSLKRVRNIKANPPVALVVDDYSEDWSKLVYVLISGTAEIISPSDNASEHTRAVELLREKYSQYRAMAIDERPIIKITPTRIKRWAPVEKGDHE
jgi:PPOX class probable F420-dependent enzyme